MSSGGNVILQAGTGGGVGSGGQISITSSNITSVASPAHQEILKLIINTLNEQGFPYCDPTQVLPINGKYIYTNGYSIYVNFDHETQLIMIPSERDVGAVKFGITLRGIISFCDPGSLRILQKVLDLTASFTNTPAPRVADEA